MADKYTDLQKIHQGGGYSSEFDEDEPNKRNWRDDELSGVNRKPNKTVGIPTKQDVTQEYSREEKRHQRPQFLAVDAYSRHKKMVNDYFLYYGQGIEHIKRDSSKDKNDYDILKEQHQFIWSEEDDSESSWEKRLAKKYYDKLFKEYCISDLSRYKENKIAMRWRIDKEVIDGKGQFICGNKHCSEMEGLKSWEVNFSYMEQGEKKSALVKLRLCPDCSYKLNYHHKRKPAVRQDHSSKTEISNKRKNKHHHKKKKKRKHNSSDESDTESDTTTSSEARGASSDSPSRIPQEEQAQSAMHGIWSGPAKIQVEKTREEEFDDYFADMFL